MAATKRLKKLSENPILLFFYFLIALVVVANIFISGYWFGRTRQVLDNSRLQSSASATASQP
jgi:hypothetical protein